MNYLGSDEINTAILINDKMLQHFLTESGEGEVDFATVTAWIMGPLT